jgi:hypothetical protein
MKVLVIGLDGITFDLLQPWIEAGELPNQAPTRQGAGRPAPRRHRGSSRGFFMTVPQYAAYLVCPSGR